MADTPEAPAGFYRSATREPVTDTEPRCWRCGKMLAYFVTRPWRLKCRYCRSISAYRPEDPYPVTVEPPSVHRQNVAPS